MATVPPPSVRSHRRVQKRIGLVVDAFNASYQAELVRGLLQACASRRIQLLVFPGGVLGAETLAAPERNRLYDLVRPEVLDGLVILSSTVAPGERLEHAQKLVAQMRPAPCFSVGSVMTGIPSVTADNSQGLRELVDHLVVEHGYRRFAFIGGPDHNEDAQQRHRAFREQLAAHGITHDLDHYVQGDFLPASGRRAVQVLFDERRVVVDAVVAANDYMAFGAIEALARHASVALRTLPVTGFDNVERANFVLPPLTTVEQRFVDMAEESVRCLLEQAEGRPLPARQHLGARLLVRRSCGCNRTDKPPSRRRAPLSSEPFEAYFERMGDSIRAELERASLGLFRGTPEWDRTLLDAFVGELRGIPGVSLLTATEDLLEGLFERSVEVWRLHGVLRVLRSHVQSAFCADVRRREHAEDLLHRAATLTSEMAVRAQARASLETEQVRRSLNRLGTRISQAATEQELKSALAEAIPALGLKALTIVRYHQPYQGADTPASRFFSLAPGEPGDGERPHELLGEAAARDLHSVGGVVLPLFFRREALGFALVDLSLTEDSYYESLRVHLSVALFGLR